MQDETPVHRQVRQRMKVCGLNPRQLSLKIGRDETYIRKFLKNPEQKPPYVVLEKIALALDCTVEDLLEQTERSRLPAGESDGEGDRIPHLDIRAAAGGGIEMVEPDFATGEVWSFPEGFIRHELHSSTRHLGVMICDGDSMVPTIGPGDPMIVDFSRTTPSPEGIFVLWDGFGRIVKRLQVVGTREDPVIRIVSDNPAYSEKLMSPEEVTIIGRVRGHWKRL